MMKVKSASKISLSKLHALPNMSDVIVSWFQPMTFRFLVDNIIDFENKPVTQTVKSEGVIQPFGSRDLAIKPEGQRGWGWYTLHCLPNVSLKVGEYCFIDDVKYRVMKKTDYTDYGYIQYEVVEAFENGADE